MPRGTATVAGLAAAALNWLITTGETVESAQDISTDEVLARDESFFAALLAGDHDALGMILAADFLLIDVLSGQVARREELLRGSAAVVTGRTRMVMCYQGNKVTEQSRYTMSLRGKVADGASCRRREHPYGLRL